MRSEFQFINDMKSRYDLSTVGDDCAVLPKDDLTDLLITADMLLEDVDFRLEWATPEQIGHKALAVSLSDIAAMGGMPTYAMISIAVAENLWKTDFLDRLYAGWHALAQKWGIELVGGDISRTSGPLTLDSIVLGEVPRGRAILRSGAHSGDGIFVTGSLGGAAGGLELMRSNGPDSAALRQKQLEPEPQLVVGNMLQRLHLATAAVDISDGLSSDLAHVCGASGLGAEIDAQRLPIEESLKSYFSPEQCLEMALNGGEDFELLFTGNSGDVLDSGLEGITLIGHTTDQAGEIVLIDGPNRGGLRSVGYRHF